MWHFVLKHGQHMKQNDESHASKKAMSTRRHMMKTMSKNHDTWWTMMTPMSKRMNTWWTWWKPCHTRWRHDEHNEQHVQLKEDRKVWNMDKRGKCLFVFICISLFMENHCFPRVSFAPLQQKKCFELLNLLCQLAPPIRWFLSLDLINFPIGSSLSWHFPWFSGISPIL